MADYPEDDDDSLQDSSDESSVKEKKKCCKDKVPERFLAAARWIPLGISPFISLGEVFAVGLDENDHSDSLEENYLRVVFVKIMDLVPEFRTYLSNLNNYEDFVNALQKAMSSTKSSNAYSIKDKLFKYIVPAGASKSNYEIPYAHDAVKETEWGWHNKVLSRLLCPMAWVHEFDQNPIEFQAQVLAGKIIITGFNWPVFCYDESKYDPKDPKKGLLQGYLLLCIYRHVFTGPGSALGGKSRGRLSRGLQNKLTKPTAETIGYAAVMARWVLSSVGNWAEPDLEFRPDDFFFAILESLDECALTCNPEAAVEAPVDRKWADETLKWWETNVPELQRRKGGQKFTRVAKSSNVDYFAEHAKRRKRLDMSNIDPRLVAQVQERPLQPQPPPPFQTQQELPPSSSSRLDMSNVDRQPVTQVQEQPLQPQLPPLFQTQQESLPSSLSRLDMSNVDRQPVTQVQEPPLQPLPPLQESQPPASSEIQQSIQEPQQQQLAAGGKRPRPWSHSEIPSTSGLFSGTPSPIPSPNATPKPSKSSKRKKPSHGSPSTAKENMIGGGSANSGCIKKGAQKPPMQNAVAEGSQRSTRSRK